MPIWWDNDINEDVGSESVSIHDKSLSAEDSQAPRGLMRSLQLSDVQLKADASGASAQSKVRGLQGSSLDEGALSNAEVEAIVRSWTVIEDHPRVVSAEIEEATCLLETEETPDHHG